MKQSRFGAIVIAVVLASALASCDLVSTFDRSWPGPAAPSQVSATPVGAVPTPVTLPGATVLPGADIEVHAAHVLFSPNHDPQAAESLLLTDPAWADAGSRALAFAVQMRAIASPADRIAAFSTGAIVSDDTNSGPQGGDRGFFSRDAMVPEFGAAVFDRPWERGDIIGPVQTVFGWHVILYLESRPYVPPPPLPTDAPMATPVPTLPVATAPPQGDLSFEALQPFANGGPPAFGTVVAAGPGSVATVDRTAGGATSTPVWTSTDGRTWSAVPDQPSLASADLLSVAAGPGETLVAFGLMGTCLPDCPRADRGMQEWTSSDGMQWQRAVGVTGLEPRVITSAAYGAHGWTAVGSIATAQLVQVPAIWTSTDGVAWTRVVTDPAASDLDAVADGEHGVVAVSCIRATGVPPTGITIRISGPDQLVAYFSADGTTWQRVVAAQTDECTSPAVVATSSGFVVSGGDTSGDDAARALILRSADGLNWTASDPQAVFADASIESLANFGTGVVAVGEVYESQLWSSTDGASWAVAGPRPPCQASDARGFGVAVGPRAVVLLELGAPVDPSQATPQVCWAALP